LDNLKYGYLDFDNFKKFLGKFKKDIKKPDINAIIRRMNNNMDGKITFQEFAQGITPEYPGIEHEPMEFNLEQKEDLVK
jgi:Ca2+-binding EF-hand superfamily protein